MTHIILELEDAPNLKPAGPHLLLVSLTQSSLEATKHPTTKFNFMTSHVCNDPHLFIHSIHSILLLRY